MSGRSRKGRGGGGGGGGRGQPENEGMADVKKSSERITKGDIFPRLTTYPFAQLVPCENTWFRPRMRDGELEPTPANVDTIFIPSAMHSGSRNLLDYNEANLSGKKRVSVYPALLLLDLVLKSLSRFTSNYSGTDFLVPEEGTAYIPRIPDFGDETVSIVLNADNLPQRRYRGAYYIKEEDEKDGKRIFSIHERFIVVLEMVLLDSALDPRSRSLIDQKIDVEGRLQGYIIDPLRYEDPLDDHFFLIPNLNNDKFAGFNVHIIGRDPMFCLRDCVVSQVASNKKFHALVYNDIANRYSNSKNLYDASTARIVANSAFASVVGQESAVMPDSCTKVYSLGELARLINDYRKQILGTGAPLLPVPDKSMFDFDSYKMMDEITQTLDASTSLPFFPLTRQELAVVLKERGVNKAQCFGNVCESAHRPPLFFCSLPPLVIQPTLVNLLPLTVLPIFMANDFLMKEKQRQLPKVYSTLYELDSLSLVNVSSIGNDLTVCTANGKKTKDLQPWEIVALHYANDVRDLWAEAEKTPADSWGILTTKFTRLLSTMDGELWTLCSNPSRTSAAFTSVLQYLAPVVEEKKSLCALVPVFMGQDPVGNAIWEMMWRINIGADVHKFHTTVLMLLYSSYSLWTRSFVHGTAELFPLHSLLMSMPGMGKSFLFDVVMTFLVQGTYKSFHDFSGKAFTDSNQVTDYIVYLCTEAKAWIAGMGSGNSTDISEKIEQWKTLLSEGYFNHERLEDVSGRYMNNEIDVVKRFVFQCASNHPTDYKVINTNPVLARYIVRVFSQAYMSDHTWKTLPRNFNSTALQRYSAVVQKLFKDQHARQTVIHVAIMSKLLKAPDLRLINLLLSRLISSDAIFHKGAKPDGRWQGKVRNLYVTVVVMGADHFLHHNPLSPHFTFTEPDETLSPDDPAYGHPLLEYQCYTLQDYRYVQQLLGPSMTAAVHAISAFVMDERLAVHSALLTFLQNNSYSTKGLREWVRYVDQKRVGYGKISQLVRDQLPTTCPYHERPASHSSVSEVLKSFHHTRSECDKEGRYISTPPDPRYTAIREEERAVGANPALAAAAAPANRDTTEAGIFHYGISYSMRMYREYKRILREFNGQSRHPLVMTAHSNAAKSLDIDWEVAIKAGEKPLRIESISDNLINQLLHERLPLPTLPTLPAWNPPSLICNSRCKIGFQKNPYERHFVRPWLPFPLTTDDQGHTFVEIDYLVVNLENGRGDMTKEFANIIRGANDVSNDVRSIDSTFISTACASMTLLLPKIAPIPVADVPTNGEEWAAYFHPDHLETCPRVPTRIFVEINKDDAANKDNFSEESRRVHTAHNGNNNNNSYNNSNSNNSNSNNSNGGSGQGFASFARRAADQPNQPQLVGSVSGIAPVERKGKVYKISLAFLMLTPQAIAEILIQTLTSQYTKVIKDIPLMCPDPASPCSLLKADVVPGFAKNIHTASVNSDKRTGEVMDQLYSGLGDHSAVPTGEVGEQLQENPYTAQKDEVEFFHKLYAREMGFDHMEALPANLAKETEAFVTDFVARHKEKAGIITSDVPGLVTHQLDACRNQFENMTDASA